MNELAYVLNAIGKRIKELEELVSLRDYQITKLKEEIEQLKGTKHE